MGKGKERNPNMYKTVAIYTLITLHIRNEIEVHQ